MKNPKNRKSRKNHIYEKKIHDFLKTISKQYILRNPEVYRDRQSISRLISRIDLFRKIQNIQGSIVECGVYQGNNLFLNYQLSNIFDPYNFKRKIIGFDTFEGFTSINKKKDRFGKKKYLNDVSYNELKKISKIQDLNKPLSHIQQIQLVKGNALKTIPKYVEKNKHLIISLLYLDFDLYEPTVVALKNFLPLMPKGALVVFDELNDDRWPGETEALKDLLHLNKTNLKKFDYETHTTYYEVN